jgi:hypothetical protein
MEMTVMTLDRNEENGSEVSVLSDGSVVVSIQT